MQPRCVHMPITTSHWSWPGLTRASSGCGSGRLLTGTARASSISFLVRWLMKIGLPRQNTLMSCPSAIGARSTSIGAPAAMVEASGFIWETNGQSAATPPTAAAAPVATKRKSRRVESTEDAVVTIPNPFLAAAGGTAPGNIQRNRRGLPAPATPAAAERPLLPANRAEQAVQNRSIGTLAGRAQARYRLASVQCTKSAPSDVLFRHFMGAQGLS